MLYGNGLRMTPEAARRTLLLPSYTTFNLGLTHGWKNTLLGNIDGRLALMNVFDRSYSCATVPASASAPQYGARPDIYARHLQQLLIA